MTHKGAKETETEEVLGDFLKRTPYLPGGRKCKVNFKVHSTFFDKFLLGH